jgi:hypothetical protein
VTFRGTQTVALLATLASLRCSEHEAWHEPSGPREVAAGDMAVGEAQIVDLRYLRFDVAGFGKVSTLEQLRAMPRRVLQDVWLFDLDARPLIMNSLAALTNVSGEEVRALTPAAQNMRKLLLMTPDNAVLEGTRFEALVGLSAAIGIPPARILADLLGRRVTDPFFPPEIVADVLLRNVIATHPNVQTRKGPVDDEHPDGRWPVPPGHVPLTLADVVTNFEDMATRFGPAGAHPGFVQEATGISVVEEEFAMATKVTANVLPFKGIDLSNAAIANVNSIASQIERLHDFSDPEWLTLTGIAATPIVGLLSFRLVENEAFIRGGTGKEPTPTGNSSGWDLPSWEFERLVLDMAQASVADASPRCTRYALGTGVEAFEGCIDGAGWVELTTFSGAGDPPAPAYVWDLELELAQIRLHDSGLAEGEADAVMTVRDVGVGLSSDEIIEQVRQNIQVNPAALQELSSLLSDSGSRGAADFFYVRGIESLSLEQQGDWLFFVTEDDVAVDGSDGPSRAYAYDSPGFFSDPELRNKASSTARVDIDTDHEKVKIKTGDVLYSGDDAGRVFRVTVLDKPGRSHVALEVARIR